jgi:hypothetical protein
VDTATLTTVDPSWAAIIAATGALVTAIGGLVLAFSVFLPTLRASKVALIKVDEVHTLVNSQHAALLSYQELLVGALRDADVVVPDDQSLRPVQPPLNGP